MTLSEAVSHFGSLAKMARSLGVSTAATARWSNNDRVPMLRQYQIEKLTKGKLKADE